MKKVLAGIIVKDEKILITRRAKGQSVEGKWEFPGGKLEENESYEECLEREILEELSLVIRSTDYFDETIYKYDKGEINLIAYFGEIVSGDISLSVHDDFRWVSPRELCEFDFAPADIPLVEKLMK